MYDALTRKIKNPHMFCIWEFEVNTIGNECPTNAHGPHCSPKK